MLIDRERGGKLSENRNYLNFLFFKYRNTSNFVPGTKLLDEGGGVIRMDLTALDSIISKKDLTLK